MKISIPYGEEEITVELAREKVNAVLEPIDVESKDESELIERALQEPIDKEPFSEFVENGTLFIVNDATRATPTATVLQVMKDVIEKKEVKFIVARGSHSDPTEEEYRRIFGELYDSLDIYSHDAEEDPMKEYGETERGTPVKFNELLDESKKVVNINSVEPHYFAGFTGGRKSFLPGIASYETIEENHSHALKENANPLQLRDNPIHEDMMEAVGMIDKDIFSLNLTLDKKNRVYHASAGDVKESFLKETEKAKEVFAVPLKERSEVVVSSAYPMDVNLYQSAKAIENGKLALKKGGILILVAECPQGIGPQNFYDLLSSIDSPEKTVEEIKKGYKLGYHKAGRMADMVACWDKSEGSEIWGVTELDDETQRKVFITPKGELQEAVDEALERTGGKVTFLKEGSMVVPLS